MRQPIGKMGDTPIYSDDRDEAKQEWAMLKQVPTKMPMAFLAEMLPPQYAQFMQPWQQETVPITLKLGPLAKEIGDHPELFLLLSLEAEAEGIVVSDDQVRTFVTNDMRGDYTIAREFNAARRFLAVQTLYDRLAANVKVTQPYWQHTLATQYQKVQLAMAEFPADKFRNSGPAPTTQQVEQQFDKFRNVDPASLQKPADDPLGFGYQTPTRVKVQYLEIAHKAVIAAVRKQKSDYDWEVEARRYYYGHENDFNRLPPKAKPVTQPSTTPAVATSTTQPATVPAVATSTSQPATLPAVASTEPAPTTGPSRRPFVEVRDEIMDKVLEQPTKDLEQKIKDAVAHRLSTDYQADRPASGATRPTDSGIASKAYLDQVALSIQKEFGVLPEVQQIGDAKSAMQLGALPGIGDSRSDQSKTFAQYATGEDNQSAPFPGAPKPGSSKPLALFEPSEPLHDTAGNVYVFRLTESVPAHAAELKEIASQVAVDVATEHAYQDAVAAAQGVGIGARTAWPRLPPQRARR